MVQGLRGFPGSASAKESACQRNAGNTRDASSIPGSGRFPGVGPCTFTAMGPGLTEGLEIKIPQVPQHAHPQKTNKTNRSVL